MHDNQSSDIDGFTELAYTSHDRSHGPASLGWPRQLNSRKSACTANSTKACMAEEAWPSHSKEGGRRGRKSESDRRSSLSHKAIVAKLTMIDLEII